MQALANFRSMELMAQAALLDDIKQQKKAEAVPALFEFLADPLPDQAVNTMIRSCLRSLLLADTTRILEGLKHAHPLVRRFCSPLAGEAGLDEASGPLMDLAEKEADPEGLLIFLTALATLRCHESQPLFHANLQHPDPYVSALCMEMAGVLQDQSAIPALAQALTSLDASGTACDFPAWKAIDGLAALGGDECLAILAGHIHHPNPTARRIIHDALVRVGGDAVKAIVDCLDNGDPDEKILAANLLGRIGDASCSSALIQAMDDGFIKGHNQLFAVIEALGLCHGMKGLVFLLDRLQREEDPILLVALVKALDCRLADPLHPAIPNEALQKQILSMGHDKDRVLAAMAAAQSLPLFQALYPSPELSRLLVNHIAALPDPESRVPFTEFLEGLGTDQARQDRDAIMSAESRERPKRLLAVDDSSAMRLFYNNAASQMGFTVSTAADGRQALDLLEEREALHVPGTQSYWDLIIVDMNMPHMDGVELTQNIRKLASCSSTPIVMVTTESEESQQTAARHAGVTEFMTKPFTLDVFQDKMTQFCP
ncbi:MAG: response regulator [Desulfovibrio sp.]|nr:MAG: response regulator [Desulfovibrio sp.]